jgi:hypothetical protein
MRIGVFASSFQTLCKLGKLVCQGANVAVLVVGCRDEDAIGNSFPVRLLLLECSPTDFFHLSSCSLMQSGLQRTRTHSTTRDTPTFDLAYLAKALTSARWVKLNVILAVILFITCRVDTVLSLFVKVGICCVQNTGNCSQYPMKPNTCTMTPQMPRKGVSLP